MSRIKRERALRILFVIAVGCAVLGLLFLGLSLRISGMIPPSAALLYQTNYDEGVNVGGAQLLLQGYTPYRDYFFAHPPLALLIFSAPLRLYYVP